MRVVFSALRLGRAMINELGAVRLNTTTTTQDVPTTQGDIGLLCAAAGACDTHNVPTSTSDCLQPALENFSAAQRKLLTRVRRKIKYCNGWPLMHSAKNRITTAADDTRMLNSQHTCRRKCIRCVHKNDEPKEGRTDGRTKKTSHKSVHNKHSSSIFVKSGDLTGDINRCAVRRRRLSSWQRPYHYFGLCRCLTMFKTTSSSCELSHINISILSVINILQNEN